MSCTFGSVVTRLRLLSRGDVFHFTTKACHLMTGWLGSEKNGERREHISHGLLAGVASEGAVRLGKRRELGAGNIVEDQVLIQGQQLGLARYSDQEWRATGAVTCVDGPRLARDHVTRRTEVACSHVSGLT
jgi:hypothetical protein